MWGEGEDKLSSLVRKVVCVVRKGEGSGRCDAQGRQQGRGLLRLSVARNMVTVGF